jgi:hypothetical protein
MKPYNGYSGICIGEESLNRPWSFYREIKLKKRDGHLLELDAYYLYEQRTKETKDYIYFHDEECCECEPEEYTVSYYRKCYE